MAKSKKKSPTALSLERLRAEGFIAQVVEQTIPHCFIKRDFIGCIDIIAFNGTETIGVQATSGSNHAARRTKSIAIPDLHIWLRGPNRHFEVWSWTQPEGKGTRYVMRKERLKSDEASYFKALDAKANETTKKRLVPTNPGDIAEKSLRTDSCDTTTGPCACGAWHE